VPVENAIRAILIADFDVSALVADRITPIVRPQGDGLPAVVYQQITGSRLYTASGPGDMARVMFQVTGWSDDYDQARELADAIREALNGYDGTISSVTIQHCRILDEGDLPNLAAGDDAATLYGKRLDFEIVYDE